MQEAVIKTVEAGVEAYGLKALPGSDGEIEVQEDVGDMQIRRILDPEVQEPSWRACCGL